MKKKHFTWHFNWKEGISRQDRISVIERMILIHSHLYYDKDAVISDVRYDSLSRILVKAKTKYPKTFKKTDYYYCFYDFDGNTGFDLFDRLKKKDKKRIKNICNIILKGEV